MGLEKTAPLSSATRAVLDYQGKFLRDIYEETYSKVMA